ncbi:MAG: 4-hydroxy-tetrahydrodipicolinate reductase [Ilumatobacteraceae bacterium]
MSSIRVGVIGANGRMGATVCEAVRAADGLDLAALVDPSAPEGALAGDGALIGRELRVLAEAGCDVAVDFSVATATRAALPFLAMHGIHAVVGTTGLDEDDIAAFRRAFDGSTANCLIAANFAISAVLMMRFAEMASPYFDTAEIIELPHDAKVDAPSGTALATASRMTPPDGGWAADPTRDVEVEGARGGLGPNGVRVHSVRMRGMTAHQEVILGAAGQTLTIRQDSYDRSSFMPGVVLACRRVGDLPGLTIGLDALL